MRPRAVLLACLLLVLPACGGGDDGSDAASADRRLVRSSFEEVVAADLRSAGYEAEPGSGFTVTAHDGPNRIDVALEEPYARYRATPEQEDEIVAGVVEDAQTRLEDGLSKSSFADVRGDLMPLLKGRFELRTYGFRPVQTPFAGRLAVVYAVDGDDAFTLVRPADVERWGTSVAEVHELALDNLLAQTNEEEPLLCEPSGGQQLCGWASSDGYDASRLAVPELRDQIVEELGGPAAYAVPMENVFIALPVEVLETGNTEQLFRVKLQRDFQTSDDPLSHEVFVERGGEVVLR
ncbi:MAG: DUF1444 family protein [Gaiellaceae bacterium]